MIRPFGRPPIPRTNIKAKRAGGYRLNIHRRFALAQLHDGTFAKVPLNLSQCGFRELSPYPCRAFQPVLIHSASSRISLLSSTREACSTPAFRLCSYLNGYKKGTGNRRRPKQSGPKLKQKLILTPAGTFATANAIRLQKTATLDQKHSETCLKVSS